MVKGMCTPTVALRPSPFLGSPPPFFPLISPCWTFTVSQALAPHPDDLKSSNDHPGHRDPEESGKYHLLYSDTAKPQMSCLLWAVQKKAEPLIDSPKAAPSTGSPISVKDNFLLPLHGATTMELCGHFPFSTLVEVTKWQAKCKVSRAQNTSVQRGGAPPEADRSERSNQGTVPGRCQSWAKYLGWGTMQGEKRKTF